jgi:RNA polymerase sigma-70 factor, ECF subfamily
VSSVANRAERVDDVLASRPTLPATVCHHGRMTGLPPDDVLVAGLRAGDDALFALLLDAWSAGMLRLARGFVSTPDSAAEVVQDAWLGVIEGIDRFEGRSTLKTWVYRILVNTAKRRRDRESRTVPFADGPVVDPGYFQGAGEPYPGHWREFPAPWPSPEEHALAGETRAVLAAAVERLPDRQRVVIVLRDVEGYTSEEVCSILEITAANQRVLLHRARAAVREELAHFYAAEGRVRP